jgi:hypothetical protein
MTDASWRPGITWPALVMRRFESYRVRGNRYRVFEAGCRSLDVKASTLDEAADNVLSAAATTGLLKPMRLLVQTTADFTAETEHPAPMNLDLIGITEIARALGVSHQRAGQLADDQDFLAPVVQPASERLHNRASVKAFHEPWAATRNPRGGRRRRQPSAY